MDSIHIPKIIHYCWFGGKPLPAMAKKCIASWQKFLPDYEIKRWDESNFDINIIPYTKEAYENKKYAFVSDYARLWILYNHGGVYFDTDVEVIKPLYDIISAGAFMGCQSKFDQQKDAASLDVNPGLGLGAGKGHKIYLELITLYNELHFIQKDGSFNYKTIVHNTSEILAKHGLKNIPGIQNIEGITVYPWDYFCPMSPTLILELTENSRTIHLFSATWESKKVRFRKTIKRLLGHKLTKIIQPVVERAGKHLK